MGWENRMWRVVSIVVTLFFVSTSAIAATYYVPNDYATIQAALNTAAGGDTIIVRDGTYTGAENKNLDFGGKALTLLSENGPEACIIDCEGSGRGFYFHNGETPDASVQGFTLTNGYVTGSYPSFLGAGIYCANNSSPTIDSCIITGNTSTWYGGGISTDYSSPVIRNCTVSGNSAVQGGGMHLWGGSPTVMNCLISGNVASLHNGGIVVSNSNAQISKCTITGNSSANLGGGVGLSYGNPSLSGCTVTQNTAVSGGGICVTGTPVITNCVISQNSASSEGGALWFDSSGCDIANCTISGNAAYWGGAVFARNLSAITVTNSILWGDTATEGPEVALLPSSTTLTSTYSDIQGGQAAGYVETGCTFIWGSGSIDADPLFVGGGDYHLTAASSCIDAGTDAGIYEDIDGDTRPQGAGFDMGADEFVLLASLSHIILQSPADGATLSSPPTFIWTVDGGDNNAYAVDFSVPPAVPFWSTYENMHQIIYDTTWTVPRSTWWLIPSGKRVFWRVRGADLNVPLTPITSDEVWSFYKQ